MSNHEKEFESFFLEDLAEYDMAKYVEWIEIDLVDEVWRVDVPGRKCRKIMASREQMVIQCRTNERGEQFNRTCSITGTRDLPVGWYLYESKDAHFRCETGSGSRHSTEGIICCLISIMAHDSLERMVTASYRGVVPRKLPLECPGGIETKVFSKFMAYVASHPLWPHDRFRDERKAVVQFSFMDETTDLGIFF